MKYVLAVSGGVDSVVLLDMAMQENLLGSGEFVVAHVDHGIRGDSSSDALFVAEMAKKYNLTFETTRFELGFRASEDSARQARYGWLEHIREKYAADAVVTAHHQDDVIETVMLNIQRGTGWRGIASLRSHKQRMRPLLGLSKAEIIQYALSHGLTWREDSTNDDICYARNFIRQMFVPYLSPEQRREFVELYERQCILAENITQAADEYIAGDVSMSRYRLIMLEREVFYEVAAAWLGRRLTRPSLDRLRHFIATAKSKKQFALDKTTYVHVSTTEVFVRHTSI